MDEIEFRRTYNEVCNAVEQIEDHRTKQSLQRMLQLLSGLNDRISELQEAAEDEC